MRHFSELLTNLIMREILHSQPVVKTTIIVAILFLISITVSKAQIKSTFDYAMDEDFSNYKTFKFATEDTLGIINEFNQKRIEEEIIKQLTSKGLVVAEDSTDLFINYFVVTNESKRATGSTNYYGPRGRWGYRYGGGFSSTSIDVESYTTGTLFIDLIDTKKNALVWQGRSSGEFKEEISPEKRKKRIEKSISKLFKNYPPK